MIESLIKARIDKTIGGKYLNIGSGEGDLDLDINEYCQELYACDINESDVLFSKKNNPNISYTLQDAERLEYEDNFFDTVVCMEVIEHVNEPKLYAEECYKLLNPGGIMICSTINRNMKSFVMLIIGAEYVLKWLPKGTHDWQKFITPDELENIFKEVNFDTVDKKGFVFSPINWDWSISSSDLSVNYVTTNRK